MSNEQSKFNHSKRLLKDDNAVKKQVKIAKQRGSFTESDRIIRQPHRLAKHHALDCGNPQCGLCGNPRHIWKDSLTAQEKRIFQDIDKTDKIHTNGLPESDD